MQETGYNVWNYNKFLFFISNSRYIIQESFRPARNRIQRFWNDNTFIILFQASRNNIQESY